MYSVFALSIANTVAFILFSAGIPHLINRFLVIPNHMRTVQTAFFPRFFRNHNRFLIYIPVNSIHTLCISYRSMTILKIFRTNHSDKPHQIFSISIQYTRSVYFILCPAKINLPGHNQLRQAPMDSVCTICHSNPSGRPPGIPNPEFSIIFTHTAIKYGTQSTSDYRRTSFFFPSSRCIARYVLISSHISPIFFCHMNNPSYVISFLLLQS